MKHHRNLHIQVIEKIVNNSFCLYSYLTICNDDQNQKHTYGLFFFAKYLSQTLQCFVLAET